MPALPSTGDYWKVTLSDSTTGSPDTWAWSAANVKNGAGDAVAAGHYGFVDSTVQNPIFWIQDDVDNTGFSVDITLTVSKDGIAGNPKTSTINDSITLN
jgi:hypothetical protein